MPDLVPPPAPQRLTLVIAVVVAGVAAVGAFAFLAMTGDNDTALAASGRSSTTGPVGGILDGPADTVGGLTSSPSTVSIPTTPPIVPPAGPTATSTQSTAQSATTQPTSSPSASSSPTGPLPTLPLPTLPPLPTSGLPLLP